MIMPSFAVPRANPVPSMHIDPYVFDVLNVVNSALRDPTNHVLLTKTFYDRVSNEYKVTRFEEMPRFIGIEVEKNGKDDPEAFIRKQFNCAVITSFSTLLAKIPGMGPMPGKVVMGYIESAFPMLNLPSSDSNTVLYHICFGI